MTKLLIDERPLTVLPSLVSLVGMERAVILQQIHWLSQQKNTGILLDDGEKWVWGNYAELCEEFFPFWKPESLRKHMNWLANKGYVLVQKPRGFDRTNHYRIHYEKLENTMRDDAPTSMRDDDDVSNRDDHPASIRKEDTAWMRDDDNASLYRTKMSTKKSTKMSTEKEIVGETPTPPSHPDTWGDFLGALCWVCHQHQEIDSLTEAQKGALTAEAKKLYAAGYTRSNLRRWLEDEWYKDWRWKKDKQRPTPAQVRAMIPTQRDSTGYVDAFYATPTASAPEEHKPIHLAQQDEPAIPPPSEPWASVLKELTCTLPLYASDWLQGSRLVETGTVAEYEDAKAGKKQVPLYHIELRPERGGGRDWLKRGTWQIRRRLQSHLQHDLMLDVVVADVADEANVPALEAA